jgi:hypothetical protein
MNKLAAAFALLRTENETLEKVGGVLSGAANVLRAGDKAGQAAAKFLAEKGHGNLAAVARVTPHIGAAYGAKKAYESDTVQGLKRKYQEHKIRKAMRQAQRGY